jgi:cell division protein FtsN
MALLETQAPTPIRLQWATTGHALSALLVAGLVWGLSTLSTPTGPVHTGPTQQDTARALAALAPTPTADTTPAPPAAAEAAPAAPDSPAALSPLEQPGQTGATTPGAPAAAVATSALAASTVAAVTASAAPAPAALPESAKPAPPPEAPGSAKAASTDKADHGSPVPPNERTKDKAGSKTDKAPSKVDKADKAEKPDSKHAAAGKTVLQPRKYYLNSGLYAQADNAQRVTRRLREAGQPVFTQLLESRQGEVTRIRVGPFDSRAQAEAAASKIQGMKLEAQVFRHLPD